jgi:hypothetical protein
MNNVLKFLTMKKAYIYTIMFVFLAIFNACQEDPEIWNSSTTNFDGNWYVMYSIDGEPESDYTTLYTYNTAANDGSEIWLTDEADFWDYKVAVPVNQENLTFGSSSALTSIVDGYTIEVTVNNGKIIKDAAELHSGAIVDSIYFEVEFGDKPGVIYQAAGFRKTGFEDDEPH